MANNRFDYVQYDAKAYELQKAANSHMQTLENFLYYLPDSREKSLVLTKLEEAYMWIGKAIKNDQVFRNGSAPLQEQRGPG